MRPADPVRLCGAKTRSGAPCRGPVMLGGVRCRMHGGSSPQARLAASERLLRLVDPAIATLRDSLRKTTDPAVRLRCAMTVLDRAGLNDVMEDYVPPEKVLEMLRAITGLFLRVVHDPELRRAFSAGLRQLGHRRDVLPAGEPALEVEAEPGRPLSNPGVA